MRHVTFLIVLAAMGLAACAPAVATADPAQIQASAMAAASTMIAMTVQAMPTETPVPPTPIPSPTPLPLPTLPIETLVPLASPTGAASAANCKGIFDVGASGAKAPVVVKNNTKGNITFGLLMTTKNSFGQCGYIVSPVIAKGNTETLSVPLVHTNLGDSCYWGYAIVNNPPSNPGGGPWCIDSQLKWTVIVSPDKIQMQVP